MKPDTGVGLSRSVAACFIPHHGLRIKSSERTIDLVICFHCSQVQLFENGALSRESIQISRSPQQTFDDILRAASVPMSLGSK